jgi:hypothetical protein
VFRNLKEYKLASHNSNAEAILKTPAVSQSRQQRKMWTKEHINTCRDTLRLSIKLENICRLILRDKLILNSISKHEMTEQGAGKTEASF